ncbi:MAG: leucine-rich repeat protein [Muribaculaceae bacterium]|nr:leucine-rich repeat protein [Muribaculaceae bacterium]
MRRLTVWILAALAVAAVSADAANIDASQAQAVARQFLASQTASKMMGPNMALKLLHAESSATASHIVDYFVFNTSNDAAFVIVSGDDRAEPILAWGEGTLDMNNLPCNMQRMLDQYKEQMEYLRANPTIEVKQRKQLSLNDESFYIAPMLTCIWGQSEPYYNQCPIYQGERCVTGCVATAMAQVMYYWKYPATAPALNSYWLSSLGMNIQGLPSKPIDWDNMIDSYTQGYTPEQADAVAMLMRYCGQSCRMNYHPNGSGSYVHNQLNGMMSFSYSYEASMLDRTNYTYEAWDSLMKADLANGMPILYSANDPNAGGHAFVVDGFYDGKYHINWGWNNTGNGYFALDAFIVRTYNFGAYQQMLHKIHPRYETEVQTDITHDIEVDGIYYMLNEQQTEAIVSSKDTKYSSYSGNVQIPAQVVYNGKTLPVTAIGDKAFRNCFDLTGIVIPEGVTSIGRQAFINCVALTSVTLPASVKHLDELAFQDCIGLTRVETPSLDAWLDINFVEHYSNPLSYAHHLFVGDEELKSISVNRSIPKFSFIECTGLESVTIQEGATKIGTAAFSYCTGIRECSLPNSLTEIEKQAFFGCKGLKSITIPEQITILGASLFQDCTGLTQMNLPESLTEIGSSAFNGCNHLKTITIPNSVVTIGSSAFANCSALTQINLSKNLTKLGESAFISCTQLKEITIPDNVTAIAKTTFSKCGQLTDVTLGKGITEIGQEAFFNSQMIKTVKCKAVVPPTMYSSDCFNRSNYNKMTLYVPTDAVAAYKKAYIWSWFSSVIGFDFDKLIGDVNGDGEVNVADINALINAIISGQGYSSCDVNEDGEIGISDVNTIVDIIQR